MTGRLLTLSKDALDLRILALPVGHLQLTERARLALREHETIGGLITALELGLRKWSPSVRSEIALVLDQLMNSMRHGTANGWEWFRRQRPKAVDGTAIYFASFSFDRFKYSVRKLPVGTLHPSTRVATALARAEITTVGDLIGAAIRGLVNPRPAGAKTCLEIIEMLDALSEAAEANGECAWDRYADSQRIMLLPRDGARRFVTEEYLKEFPVVVEGAGFSGFSAAGGALARERILCAGRRASLNEIASQFAVSRQEISRLRDLIMDKLRAVFLGSDYAGGRLR